jgi:hypothetical protein
MSRRVKTYNSEDQDQEGWEKYDLKQQIKYIRAEYAWRIFYSMDSYQQK